MSSAKYVLRSIAALSAALLYQAFTTASAQSSPNVIAVTCDSDVLDGGNYADVIIKGSGCTLKGGAQVFGSVKVESGETRIEGGTIVLGGFEANGAGNVTVNNSTVFGELKVENSGQTMIQAGAAVGGISVTGSGDVTVANATAGEVVIAGSSDLEVGTGGTVAAIFVVASGSVDLTDGLVSPGGVSMGLSGALTADNLSVIEGTVIVEKGTGAVTLNGTGLNSDLTVIEQNGNISVFGGATVSDIKIEKSTGDIMLSGVTTDSDTTILENDGVVTIENSAFGSDAAISKNKQAVNVLTSSFDLEDVLISSNGGIVTIDGNSDLRPTVTENPAGVDFLNNAFTEADISKNGDVLINFNTGIAGGAAESLSCSDNSFVAGSGNNIEFTDGQCAGL